LVHVIWGVPFDPDPLTVNRFLLGLTIMLSIMALTAVRRAMAARSERSSAGLEGAVYTIRAWLPYLMVGTTYQLIQPAVVGLRTGTIDITLMDMDRSMFLGNDPVLLMENLNAPVLTDWFAFCYSLYFLLPGGIALLLHFRERREEFRLFMLAMVVSFYLGFLGYIFLPAVGPRLTIPDGFQGDLKGIIIWDQVRAMYNDMESINRDCFPSLHTAHALIPLYFSYRFKDLLGKGRTLFYILLPVVVSICISTVYLRYHWVVDVIAGALLAAVSIALGSFLFKRFPWPGRGQRPKGRGFWSVHGP
jgi:membrane-associated phospholipid phosphatase